MKKFLASFALLALVAVVSLGCSKATPPVATTAPAEVTKVNYAPASLCGKCGEIKGTEACCAEGADVCSKCNLHKGAPGCCKMEKRDRSRPLHRLWPDQRLRLVLCQRRRDLLEVWLGQRRARLL